MKAFQELYDPRLGLNGRRQHCSVEGWHLQCCRSETAKKNAPSSCFSESARQDPKNFRIWLPFELRSIGVGHADLPGIGVASIDCYCVTLPHRDSIFRDHAYVVADGVHLNNLAINVKWRCEIGCIPFLDGLLAGSQSTFRESVPQLNRVLCE